MADASQGRERRGAVRDRAAAGGRRGARGAAAGDRRRAALSLEAVIDGAVVLLDEAGESALTFRALAAHLGGGPASIYWYVSSKDELLDRATDRVLEQYVTDTEGVAGAGEPLDDLRALALALFETVREHPWTGAYMMREGSLQPHAFLAYERLGEQVLRLGLPPRETFHAASAVLGFVVGTAIDLGQKPPPEVADGSVTRDEYLERFSQQWRGFSRDEYPFIAYIVDEFSGHDDADQFRAGLDLLLAGLREQATRKGSVAGA